MSDVSRRLASAVLAMAAVLPLSIHPQDAAAQAEITWPEAMYNPSRDVDDLVLPMPCGGAMVFRRIETAVGADPLDDRQVVLGGPDPDLAYSEYILRDHLAGGFDDVTFGGGRINYYFLGKYEVTRDQYATLMADACPEPGMLGRRPVTDVSWFDAVSFSEAYTTWLWTNAPDVVPHQQDRRGYLRLPTETEWEFAARGGEVATEQEFRDRLFPHAGDLARYAWFHGQQSADGLLRPVGLLDPNPLNLHDILGNAEELVLEPFRLNRVGRRHGQIGGIVTRGGSFRTLGEDLRSAWRQEYSFYDETTGAALRLETIGFRLVISVPVMLDQTEAQALRNAWAAVAEGDLGASAEDPLAELDALADETTDLEQRQRLEMIRAALSTNEAEGEALSGRSLSRAISSGAVLIRTLRYDRGVIGATETALRFESQLNAESERAERLNRQLAAMRERYDITLRAYFEILLQAADDYPAEMLSEQLQVVTVGFEQQNLATLAVFADLFVTQVLAYQESQDLDPDAFQDQLLAD